MSIIVIILSKKCQNLLININKKRLYLVIRRIRSNQLKELLQKINIKQKSIADNSQYSNKTLNMRLIVRVKNQASKLEHIAEKQINQGLSSRSETNPFDQSDDSRFQLSYLVTHNTKVLRTTFTPTTYQMDELIAHISKMVNIGQQYLILRMFNRYHDVAKQKVAGEGMGMGTKFNKMKQQKVEKVEGKVGESGIFGGVRFSQQTIQKVKLVKGFSLLFYNINLIPKPESGKPVDPLNPQSQTMKTLQVQAQILPSYYRSAEYKKIISQNRQSQMNQINARLTFIHGNIQDRYGVKNVIKEEVEGEDEELGSKKYQNIKFVDLQVQGEMEQQRRPIYDPSIYSFKGQLLRIRKPPLKDHKYYYQVDPYQGFFKQFQSKQKYPKSPSQVFSLNLLHPKDIQRIDPKSVSWYMKKEMFYFTIQFNGKNKKQKYKFGCNFEDTVQKWVQGLRNAIQKWTVIMNQRSMLLDLVRNDRLVLDMRDMFGNTTRSPKKQTNKYIQVFESTINRIQEDNTYDDDIQPSPKLLSMKSQSATFSRFQQSKQQLSTQLRRSQSKSSATTVPQGEQSHKKQTRQQPHVVSIMKAVVMIDKRQEEKGLMLKHFRFTKQLGEGSFGQVFLAQCTRNNFSYALKVFKKKKLVLNKQIKFAISQINILKQISHPFVITLHFTFQTPNYIYLGLDYCSGKDLSHHLIQQINFPQPECQFYAAQLVLALEYLHGLDIIYRDLKPENILLDQEGHLKIIDFGLSKQAENNIAKSFCGSPAYISPEMLKKNGVGKECDFFSLGAVIYEMLVGEPPFYSEDIKELYDNIANAKLKFPKIVSQRARSLLQGLLRKNPKQRLGSKGFEELKSHQFFKGIDWNKVLRKQCTAPRRVDSRVVKQKQEIEDYDETQLLKIIHEDFDYSQGNWKVNRFKNFSFVRQGEFQ